jgi:hypothetical protein
MLCSAEGRRVKTGSRPHTLDLGFGRSTQVFLIGGSFEERGIYAGEVLENTVCQIVLCSVQYLEEARSTWEYVFSKHFQIYAQWLNPGNDDCEHADSLGLINILLHHNAVLSVRDARNGEDRLHYRVEEIRQSIYGWASARGLVEQPVVDLK